MNYFEAKSELIHLLGCNFEVLSADEFRKRVKKAKLAWHPDKTNRDPSKTELFIRLDNAYKIYCKGPNYDPENDDLSGTSAQTDPDFDLFCHETWDETFNTEDDSDDDFVFTPSPKKNFNIPIYLEHYLRSKSNRRAGKLFLLFCELAEGVLLENYLKNAADIDTCFYFHTRTNKDIACAVAKYKNDYRVCDIKKRLRKADIKNELNIAYAVKYSQLLIACKEKMGEPKFAREGIKIPEDKTNKFNMKQFVDYAISHEITEYFELMYEYAHLALPCDRLNVTKDHEDDHSAELENAHSYLYVPDRARYAKNAIQCVTAKLYQQLKLMSNNDYLALRISEIGNQLLENNNCKLFGEAMYYFEHIIGLNKFRNVSKTILSTFCIGEPKRRYVALQGQFGSGKSTFAALFKELFNGITININVSRDRLPFYLGSAIGKRYILFDDVKGFRFVYPPALPTGYGISNLDDIRDHLDGHIDVQLEKKNQNPVSQKFPPGIITLNNYIIPKSLKERILTFKFSNNNLYTVHRPKITVESLVIALIMHDLVIADSYVIDHISTMTTKWKTQHASACDCLKVSEPL